MSFLRQFLWAIGLMVGAAVFTLIYLLIRQQITGDLSQHSEIHLYWPWENITLAVRPNLWLDPILAAAWVLLPTTYYFSFIRSGIRPEIEPVYGLLVAVGYYIGFWGDPSAVGWLTAAFIAPIIGKIVFMINEQQDIKQGARWLEPYTFSVAISFSACLGFGLFLPLALQSGFGLAFVMLWLFVQILLIWCLLIFLPIWFFKLGRWMLRRKKVK